jgi:hypothetical protein
MNGLHQLWDPSLSLKTLSTQIPYPAVHNLPRVLLWMAKFWGHRMRKCGRVFSIPMYVPVCRGAVGIRFFILFLWWGGGE